MALRLQRRSAFGWPASAAGWANPTRGIAIHYEGADTGIAGWTHDRCIAHWKATRVFHMGPSRDWKDIGYSFSCCPHYVMEGRGKDRAQAAQPGGNTTWYSCTFMTGPGEQPHPGQIRNFRELRAWLRADGVAAAIRPHSSFVSTGCPGDILRRMIADGTLTRPSQEEDMPLTDAEIDKIADRTSERTLQRLANETGALPARARRQIAEEVLFRTRANLWLRGAKESVNFFTLAARGVQQTVALSDAVAEIVTDPDEPPVDDVPPVDEPAPTDA